MATELWLQRRLGHLVPANSQSAELLAGLPNDKWMLATIRMPRNVKHHRKYWALMQAVFPHQSVWPTMKSFQRAMKKALGHGEWVASADGRKEFIEESISFANMDQSEFEQFYARAVEVILTKVLPNVDSEDLEREVAEILKGNREDAADETGGGNGSQPAPEPLSVREPAHPGELIRTREGAMEYARRWGAYYLSLPKDREEEFIIETEATVKIAIGLNPTAQDPISDALNAPKEIVA